MTWLFVADRIELPEKWFWHIAAGGDRVALCGAVPVRQGQWYLWVNDSDPELMFDEEHPDYDVRCTKCLVLAAEHGL